MAYKIVLSYTFLLLAANSPSVALPQLSRANNSNNQNCLLRRSMM